MSIFDFLNSPAEFARVLGLVVPLLVAVAAKEIASPRLKSIIHVALAGVAAVAATLVGADGSWAWGTFFNAWLNAFITGVITYYGALKPTGLSGYVAAKTALVGIGTDLNEPGYSPADHDHGIPGIAEPEPGEITPLPDVDEDALPEPETGE